MRKITVLSILMFIILISISLLWINHDRKRHRPIQRVIETNYTQLSYVRETMRFYEDKFPCQAVITRIGNPKGEYLPYTNIIIVKDCWYIEKVELEEKVKALDFLINRYKSR